MVSQVFGELKYDYLWEGKIRIFIYGKEVEVKLDIEDEDEQGIFKIQEESFLRFRERKLEIDNKIQKGGIIRMCEQVAASGNTLILYSA